VWQSPRGSPASRKAGDFRARQRKHERPRRAAQHPIAEATRGSESLSPYYQSFSCCQLAGTSIPRVANCDAPRIYCLHRDFHCDCGLNRPNRRIYIDPVVSDAARTDYLEHRKQGHGRGDPQRPRFEMPTPASEITCSTTAIPLPGSATAAPHMPHHRPTSQTAHSRPMRTSHGDKRLPSAN